jgi:tetratricopeptide (TPR) repeat protein
MTVGCADSAAETEPEGPLVVEEIPVTTSSETALEHFLAGRESMDTGDEIEARSQFAAAAEVDPSFVLAHLQAASVSGSFPEFRRHLDAAAAATASASDGEQLLVSIYQTYLANDTEKRLKLSEKLARMYPNSPRAYLNLASVLGSLNRNEEARDAISHAIRLEPELPVSYTMLGFQYLFSEPKNFARSEANMRKFIELRPELGKGYEYLGDVMRAQGKLELASAAYSRAVEMDESNAVAGLKVGHINSFLGNYAEARRAYDVALAVAEEDVRPTYANYRAFTSIHEGDIDAALQELEEIVAGLDELSIAEDRKRSARAFTLYNQAMIALHHDRFAEAEEILRLRAAVVRAIGEEVGSAEVRKADEANIVLWQGRLAARRGDFEAAGAMAKEYKSLVATDNNPRKLEAYHEILGLINLEQKNYLEAARQFQDANLNEMYVKYHLGLAEEGAGNDEAARKIFQEVSEWNFNSVGYALVREETMRKYRGAGD